MTVILSGLYHTQVLFRGLVIAKSKQNIKQYLSNILNSLQSHILRVIYMYVYTCGYQVDLLFDLIENAMLIYVLYLSNLYTEHELKLCLVTTKPLFLIMKLKLGNEF